MKQFPSLFLDLVDGVEEIFFGYLSQNVDCEGPTNRFFAYESGSWGTQYFPCVGEGLKQVTYTPRFAGRTLQKCVAMQLMRFLRLGGVNKLEAKLS